MKRPLTDRHMQVLALRAQGIHNKAAAKALGLSLNTINDYCTEVIRRLDAHTMEHAVAKAMRAGLLEGVEL